ncbi:hypothetical protein GGR51DRAFT_561245 [Nemania sp. FL0031]|nr:hypothetical protein GGR51DRAFT_561245 [Nemania sp. FL0031]
MPKEISSKPILKDCVVGVAGYLGDYGWREEKVEQWVTYWGGQFTHTIDGNVTHLLCTEEDFNKRIAPVRAALRNKDTKIVLRDWLEDSIWKKVRLRTLQYDLGAKAKEKEAKKQKIKKMERCSSNAENYVDERFWHPYRDSTYFEYQIQLKRNDEESGNVGEKHLLTLWESNAKPFTYQCTTLFTKKSKNKGSRYPLNESPVNFDTAFRTFKSFFKKKTTIAWDDRIEKMGSTGPENFQYTAPFGGKPVGYIEGRFPSIFGNGDGKPGFISGRMPSIFGNGINSNKDNNNATASDSNDSKEETSGPAKASLKHGRPESGEEDDDSKNNDDDDQQQPAKRSRRESGSTDDDDSDGSSSSGYDTEDCECPPCRRRKQEDYYDIPSSGLIAPASTPVETGAGVDNNNGDIDDSGAGPDANADPDIDDERDGSSPYDDSTGSFDGPGFSSQPPAQNDADTAREMERMYDGVQETELDNDSISTGENENGYEQHGNNGGGGAGQYGDRVDDDDELVDLDNLGLPDAISAGERFYRSACATAEAIYRESTRGTLNVADNQAAQIAATRAQVGHEHDLALRQRLAAMEEEEEEAEEDDDGHESDDTESFILVHPAVDLA